MSTTEHLRHGVTPDWMSIREVTVDRVRLASRAIVGFNSSDMRARPFQLLRTQLLKRLNEQKIRLVGITSAEPEAGKSFLSLNLSAALSQLPDMHVILVDLDLRRGSIGNELGVNPEFGLLDFLSGKVKCLQDVALQVSGTSLIVIPTRPMDGAASELLAGREASHMLEVLRQTGQNTVIIFDLPPVFADDDAMIIMQKLDGFLLVTDSGRTNARQIQDCITMLQPSPCLGTIMNRYVGGLAGSYGYGYGAPSGDRL